VVGGRTLFATINPALASLSDRLLGSLLYFWIIPEAARASCIFNLAGGAGSFEVDDDDFRRELRKSLTVSESTAVPNVLRSCPYELSRAGNFGATGS